MTPTAIQARRHSSSSSSRRGLPLACALLALFALLLPPPAPASAGADAAERPPSAATPDPGAPPAAHLEFAPFNDQAFLAARKSGAPVALIFEADWCGPCQKMHAKTYGAPAVLEAAAGIRFFRVDLSKPDHYVDLVKKSFRVFGAPTVILFGPDGKESGRRFGFIPPDDFAKLLGASRKPASST